MGHTVQHLLPFCKEDINLHCSLYEIVNVKTSIIFQSLNKWREDPTNITIYRVSGVHRQ